MTISPLGVPREMTLAHGTLRYHDIGAGPPVVLVHGLFANSALWRDVIAELAPHFRCIAPDLPLGGHELPMPNDADVSPLGVAQMLAEFIDNLGLTDIILVGNDTGGALCQLLIARYPQRVGRLVLTNCDAFDQFFPTMLQPLQMAVAQWGDRFTGFLARLLRRRQAQRLLVATVAKRRLDDAMLDTYFHTFVHDPAIQHDTARFVAAVSGRLTLEAARTFAQFTAPVLLMWGKDDFFFSARLARRLQNAFPHATLQWVPDARAFVPEDQPHLLAQAIVEFTHVDAPTRTLTSS